MSGCTFRWVGTRRVALPYVSSCPPLKTVRTTFMVYGLAPAVSRRVPTKRPFPLRQLHSAFPVDSLRVRWIPLFRSFAGLGPSLWGRFPVWTAFLSSDYYAPSDSPRGHRTSVRRFPLTTSPLLFASLGESPVFPGEDANEMREEACCFASLPRFAAPQDYQRIHRLTSVPFCGVAYVHHIGPYSRMKHPVSGSPG